MATTLSDQSISTAETYLAAAVSVSQKVPRSVTTKIGTVVVSLSMTNVYPKVQCVDFGEKGMIDKNNNVLKGRIIITHADIACSSVKYVYDDLSVNGIKIKGYKTATKLDSAAMEFVWSDTTTYADSKVATRYYYQMRKRRDVNNTPTNYKNDTYELTGTITGINKISETYTIEITKPLISESGSKYFVSGTQLTLTKKGIETRDYGIGQNDSIATSQIDDKAPKQIHLN